MRQGRRRFVLLGAGAFVLRSAEGADAKTPVLGLLWIDSVRPSPFSSTLVRALQKKGYAVDRNFRITDGVVQEGYGSLEASAAELVNAKVDLIVSYGSTATSAAAKATQNIPIVMIAGFDPVSKGLAASLSHPGGNLTGVSNIVIDLTAKRVQLVKELI